MLLLLAAAATVATAWIGSLRDNSTSLATRPGSASGRPREEAAVRMKMRLKLKQQAPASASNLVCVLHTWLLAPAGWPAGTSPWRFHWPRWPKKALLCCARTGERATSFDSRPALSLSLAHSSAKRAALVDSSATDLDHTHTLDNVAMCSPPHYSFIVFIHLCKQSAGAALRAVRVPAASAKAAGLIR